MPNTYPEWQFFFPSSSDVLNAWGETKDESEKIRKQESYMRQCFAAATEAAGELDKEIELITIYKFFADKRRIIAKKLNQRNHGEIGIFRQVYAESRNTHDVEITNPLLEDDGLNTPLKKDEGRYADQYLKLKDKFDALYEAKEKVGYDAKEISFPPPCPAYREINIRYKDGKFEIPLSIIKFSAAEGKSNPEELRLYHTNITRIGDAFKVANIYFKNSLKWKEGQQGVEVLYYDLGRLNWWLAQATPCRRGSAATAEILTCAILKYHRQVLYPFREGVSADLEALFAPQADEFASRYENLFARTDEEIASFHNRYSQLMTSPAIQPDLIKGTISDENYRENKGNSPNER
jgi:hypothetical protein